MTDFFKRIIRKPPALFPWVALFHIGALLFSIWNYSTEPFPSIGWLQPLWLLGYAVSWLFICDMKRWAAISYIALTSLNLLLLFLFKSEPTALSNYTDTLFPMNVLFTFFVMFYFKFFE